MNREIRHDDAIGQRLTVALLLFGGAVLTLGTVVAWLVLRSREAAGVPSLVLVVIFLAAAAATANLLYAYGRLRWFYRCPQCTARVPRTPEAGARLRYECADCGVDWDTGWSENDVD